MQVLIDRKIYDTKKYLINYYVKLTFKSHSIMHSIHCDSIRL